jgi:von Willebrand factor type A domain
MLAVARQEGDRMRRLLWVPVVSAALAIPAAGRATTGAEVQRMVYFSARDAKGVPVMDLTVADLTVKEGGKERAVRSVEPATAPLQMSILVDDAGTGAFQAAVARFIQTMYGKGQFVLRSMTPQPSRLTDLTDDGETLKAALGRIGPRGRIAVGGEQIPDAVAEAALELQQRKAVRPVIVVLTGGGELAQSDQSEPALRTLKNSGAMLNVVHTSDLALGPVLGDGPARSGGMSLPFTGVVVPESVLSKLADNLLHQCVLTYTLPDGVKPNEKFALATSRKGVTLIAPSRVPDK